MRERLAAQVIAANALIGETVADALRDVPRHLFLPELRPDVAYTDDAIVTKRDESGRPISSSSQPAMMAIMLVQLDLAPGQRVLEIGAGTGYNAALVRHIIGGSGQVTSVDIDGELVGKARAHLAAAGYPDVTVLCADGAGGCPAYAPYDRIIATVGVSDLAPAWLEQAGPAARIVVPLDVRGTQVSVAFARAGDGHWTSRSLAPCGFMRMRGSIAGPEAIVPLAPGLYVTLPDGVIHPAGQEADGEALGAVMAGRPVLRPTGVSAGPAEVFWELGLWLATREPRACRVDEEQPADPAVTGPRLGRAPLRGRGWHATVGILDPGSIAVLTAAPGPQEPPEPPEPPGSSQDEASGPITLVAAGFGPDAAQLAGDLAAHARAWDQAGRPGVAGLRVDAYPKPARSPEPGRDALVIDRPSTRFVVSHAQP